jgi:hypothetical protein
MTLPADWTQVPVTGTYVGRDGVTLAGKLITFDSDQVVVIDGVEIVPARIICTLDADGAIPDGFTLPSTDDPDLSVTGWAYAVRERWDGGRSFNVFVEYNGGPINLPNASPVATPPELQSALSAEVVAAAQGYALAAEASALAAEDAAADVGDSADAAAASAAAASASADAASVSAGTATTKAAEAAASAASIGTAVTESAASAAAAATSADTAGNAATAAGAAQTGAETAQAASETAKAAAEAAQGAAETAATSASNSATAASDSAAAAAALIAGTSLLRHGDGAPDNALGDDGDYYLDDVAPKTLYGPKAAGAWPAGVSLQGAPGAAGPTGRIPNVQSVTSAATVTPTFDDDLVKITAQAAALALANPTGTAIPGLGIVIRIKDNGTARAISYGTQYRAIGVTLPTTTVVGKTTYLAGIWNDTDTTLDIVAVGTQA